MLSFWEFEFYKPFHLLRDGTQLPASKMPPPSGFKRLELRRMIETLKRMSAQEYWLTSRRVGNELGEKLNLSKPPISVDLLWAEGAKADEIFWLERASNPPKIHAAARRRKMWNDLVQANTYAALHKVCGRWAQMPGVRGAGMTAFPKHILENAGQFLFMKRNKRFPLSNYGDDARLEFLARGMAGVMLDVSPMTGVERLRNMKHGPGGPFWIEREGNRLLRHNQQHCDCWRCGLRRGNELTRIMQTAYDNGLRLFMEIAASTRPPKEWSNRAELYRHLRRT